MFFKAEVFVLLITYLHFVISFPTELGDSNKCQSRNGKFPKPGSSCRSYYSCSNWRPQEKVCPQDQHFFPAKGYCVWPEEYPCLEKSKSNECPLPNGKFLKPGTKCKVYYDCCNGRPTEKKCAKGTLFDHVRGKCDWPEYVTCPDEPKSKKCPRLNGKFLKPGSGCKIFYECHDGISTERKCPKEQLFDPYQEKCEWLEIYTCVEEPKSRECVRPNGKFLRPRTRCKIYYDCRDGIATEKRCADDLLFNPAREKCEWPELYTCVEDISTTESTSQSTSTLVSISTTETTDSDEDNSSTEGDSSEEGSSSEEGNSSEENRKSSTRSEIVSTSVISSTTNDDYTESTEGDIKPLSTESSSTVENSSRGVASTAAPDDSSTILEISTASFTDEYVTETTVNPKVITEETHTEVVTEMTHPETVTEETHTEVMTKETHPEIVTGETHTEVVTELTYPEILTGETRSEVMTKETQPEIVTGETHTEIVTELTYPEILTGETRSEVMSKETQPEIVTGETHTEVVTGMTHPEIVTGETHTEVVTEMTYPEILTGETHTEVMTKETHSEIVTEETHTDVVTKETHPEEIRSEATYTVENKDQYSTTVTPGLTDSVTSHIFCPKPNGYFPHPYDRHKFIACIGGNPTVMNCPEDLVYDHKKRSCEYNTQK